MHAGARHRMGDFRKPGHSGVQSGSGLLPIAARHPVIGQAE